MRPIGEGFNTRVFLSSDGGWVLKAAKHEDVLRRLIHERAALERVPGLPIALPRDYDVIEPCSSFPSGASCYRYIDGRPCTTLSEIQQQQLGYLICQLHQAVSSASVAMTGLVRWEWRTFAGCLTGSELEELRELFDAYPSERAVVRLVHGDLWPENIIERDGQLVGLVDWAESDAGDVAVDFAGLAYLPDVLDGVLRAYADAGGLVGDAFPQRLTVARLSRELAGLQHAIFHPRTGELAESVSKVRKLLGAA